MEMTTMQTLRLAIEQWWSKITSSLVGAYALMSTNSQRGGLEFLCWGSHCYECPEPEGVAQHPHHRVRSPIR